MRFHPEVPLVALFGLVHSWVTLTAAVLGRAGRGHDGGVHHGAGLKQQALMVVSTLRGELVFLQQVAKAPGGALWASPSFPDGLLSPLSLAQSRLG